MRLRPSLVSNYPQISLLVSLSKQVLCSAHELGHWYYMHPTKMMAISQIHIFTILALFPAFLHAPPLLRSFDFPKAVAAQPPTIVAFLLFQVCYNEIWFPYN